ncbi:MAG: bifunctional metallophosphatase/5'-nucleotidase [Candidatus Heimdallarchaeota archaeon]|nr:bifunctional metallophosphatase/5'-nucleotidase [Candidatus Heimdallarchaeota archaeon]
MLLKFRRNFVFFRYNSIYIIIIISISFFFSDSSKIFGTSVTIIEGNTLVNPLHPLNSDNLINLTILHINDLHGWLNPHEGYGGVATYMTYFKNEGFNPNDRDSSFLLLSGGDQNTGPAVATLSKGEAVVDVMNSMGFSAAAIGNHEFDFGINWMEKRQIQANYPILSSNIYETGTTKLANFSIPWVIQNHSGVNIGIIGLTTITTYSSAHPKITQYFDFGDYETALRSYIPAMRDEGAEIIICLAHVPPIELQYLAEDVADLNIDLYLGGHSGGGLISQVSSSLIAGAEHYGHQYVKVILSYSKEQSEVIVRSGTLIDNLEAEVEPDQAIQSLVDEWINQVDADRIITYSSTDVRDDGGDSGISALVTDSFLYYFNYTYNFGIANAGGGFRDYFRAGNITLADIVSVFPFENNLLAFSITGEELKSQFASQFLDDAHSGLKLKNEKLFVFENGHFTEVITSKTYNGLILDYIWYVSYKDSFNAIDTAVHYRDAVVYYFEHLEDLSNHVSAERSMITLPFPIEKSSTQPTSVTGIEPLLALFFLTFILQRYKKKCRFY